jgi:non-specific serine/threonine protein kinase/serine/threonine-protein kinase
MGDHRWDRLKVLFDDANRLPASEQAGYLDRTCADDPGLRADLEALLGTDPDETLDPFDRMGASVRSLAEDAADAEITGLRSPAAELPHLRVGPYRLIREIGRGGMGTVFLAERDDGQFSQRVALKLIRTGGASAEAQRRFRAERQILARLQHPHIARLLDGGLTAPAPDAPDGLPYFVMEYVEGDGLIAYCDHLSLGLDARLDLFLNVCDAVAYAHRNLVVHRDLKPSNVLVAAGDDGPTVKLLDFGIAKLLATDGNEGEDMLTTHPGYHALTPEYAAPEQIAGEPVTTVADVYALGVLLYELLTGQRPNGPEGQTPTGGGRMQTSAGPVRPSTALGQAHDASERADRRADTPVRLTRRLQGDLDQIVLEALRADPRRRYASVDDFAEDLRRHRAQLPVRARPETPGYLASRFVRRHRAAVGVTVGVAVLAASLIGFYTARLRTERDAADRRFAVARDAARAMIYDVHDAVAGIPGATVAREVVITRSLEYLDRLADEAGHDPALRLDLAEAYFRVGSAQGNPTNNNLGRTTEARASYRRGLGVLPPPATPALGDTLGVRIEGVRGRLYEKLGVVEAYRGRVPAALALVDRAIGAHARALAAAPDSAGPRVLLATSLINRGDYTGHPGFPNAGRPGEASRLYRRARGLLEAIPAGRRGLFALRMIGVVHEREGTLARHRGDYEAALTSFQASARVRAAVARRPDATADALRDAAIAREKLGEAYLGLGRLGNARAEFEAALSGYQALAARDTADTFSRETLAIGHLHLARLHGGPAPPNLGDRATARWHYRAALALLRPLGSRDRANARTRGLIEEAERDLHSIG